MKIQKYQIMMVRDSAYHIRKASKPASGPEIVAAIAESYLRNSDREQCLCLALDTRNNLIGMNTISIGSLDCSVVHPREVFKFAILANASSIILAHNHPSGDLTPSDDDVRLTKRLMEAGEIIGIDVLDHIIIGGGTYKSIAAAGLLK